MLRIFATVGALMLGMGVVQVGHGLLSTLLGLRLALEGVSTETIGLVMSCYFLGQITGPALVPRLIDRVGHIRTFAAAAAILAAVSMIHVLLIVPIVWALLRTAAGISMAGLIMISESWLNDRVTNATRGRVLALYMITIYTALALGQFLLNLGDPARFELFLIAGILVTLGLVPVVLTRARVPAVEPGSNLNLAALYRISPLGVAGVVGTGLVNGAFWGLGPVYAVGVGWDTAGVSLFMGLTIVGGLVMQWPVGRLSDRYDRRTVLTCVFFGVAVACLCMVAATHLSLLAVLILAVVYGGLSFTTYSLSISHANDFVAPRDRIRASGGFVIAYGVGAVFGPSLASLVIARMGPDGLFAYSAAINLALGLFALYRMRQREPVPNELQRPFVSLPATSPMVKSLDPQAVQTEADFEPEEPAPEPAR